MENAADALKMAAAILIFIIAIASSFSLFGTAKQTADSIIGMRDKQAYLEAAEEEVGGILYTSSSSIKGENVKDNEGDSITTEYVAGVTKNGDRVVEISDVISTIYRYSKEKYGVTIVKSDGTVIARFDTSTETYIQNYNTYGKEFFEKYKDIVRKNIKTDYCEEPKFTPTDKIEDLYKIKIEGNNNITYGIPWNVDDIEIQKKINADISGGIYEYNGQTYEGKNLLNELKGKKIIEVTNEIDQSKYLKQTDENDNEIKDEEGNVLYSNLLQQYEMPTVEIIYIVYND